jgi:beta-galactosidase
VQSKLNDAWRFALGEPENFAPVELPHDWLIADARNLYSSGVGWYERELDAGLLEAGQRLSLRFDGVYMDSAVYVNGRLAGEWKYGYTAFEFDVTDLVRTDRPNLLRVRVDYRSPSDRWYTGAGIYRDVFLVVKPACRFVAGGIAVATVFRDGRWSWEASAEVETGGKAYEVRHRLFDAAGAAAVRDEDIAAWDVDAPKLYTVRSELIVDGAVADTEDTRTGFRTTEFTTDRGFFLNGRPLKLNGVCLHHDLGALGAAVHPDAVRRQLALFKAMGANAVRTAHNPPAAAFMDLADEMGILVLSEIFDVWRRPKNEFDYARFFDAWSERDVASWIRRDRNRPSVILWSVGNEIHDTHLDAADGAATLSRLLGLVKRNDPAGHAPATLCSNYLPWENTQQCADLVKLVGYNYAEALYPAHHARYPDWAIYGGETCSTVQSRGVYHFPLTASILADDDLQCSALGNSATSWGAKSVEACVRADLAVPYSLGQFVWSGQDYLGEPTPYHTKNSYFGQADTAGFPKDSYYVFKAAWTDYRKAPFVHLFPYWDWSPGQPIDLRVCSNAPAVALYFNGELVGRTTLARAGDAPGERRYLADFRLAYRPGVLRAVACDESGAAVAEASKRSFGDAAALAVVPDRWGELTFAEISAVDAAGVPVENANRRVRVSVEDGELLALDNGDSTDYDQFGAANRRLFGGKLLAIVRSPAGRTPRIEASFDAADVPIRKIELAADGPVVRARTFPLAATYADLEWRLTDAAGIDSQLGRLAVAPDGRSATVEPKGDGEVYVRCAARNGRGHPSLISVLPLSFTGLGKAFLDPYGFVSGGLYSRSNVEPTNGNERGVATLRDGETRLAFDGLDFGPYGSDEIALPLFPLSKEPFDFEIWEGMPEEGGEKLLTARYDLGSIWNSYQEAVYRLPRRLRGVTTLGLVFRLKVHVKGFRFTKFAKAFQRLPAADCDSLYGDSYRKTGGAVEGIGNNVSLVFADMDFGKGGAAGLELCWRSRLERNAVQLIVADGRGESRRMIEVGRSDEYSSAVFPLGDRLRGPAAVTLSFLPGVQLDLAWIRFLA